MTDETLLFAYHDGTAYAFAGARGHASSSFGGPLEIDLGGVAHGPRPLHQIARLSSDHLPVLGAPTNWFELPLIYGLCYDGCRLEYRVDASGDVELLDLDPTRSSDDHPYVGYPSLLPYVPLALAATTRASYAEFANRLASMPPAQPSELVVAIPPPATLGVSLWGRFGDAEGVTIVFECDPSARIVRAYNACS